MKLGPCELGPHTINFPVATTENENLLLVSPACLDLELGVFPPFSRIVKLHQGRAWAGPARQAYVVRAGKSAGYCIVISAHRPRFTDLT